MENKLVRERIEGCRRWTPAVSPQCQGNGQQAAMPGGPGKSHLNQNHAEPPRRYQASHCFTAGLPQHFHLNIEQKDDSRRVEDLGVTQDQHFGYTKSFLIWFLLTLSSSYTPPYPPFTPHFLEKAHSPVKTQSKIYLF